MESININKSVVSTQYKYKSKVTLVWAKDIIVSSLYIYLKSILKARGTKVGHQ